MVQQTVQITTEQGQPLGGTLFHADNIAHNSAILICGGTGFLQKYYAPLATWLDFRGIHPHPLGNSANPSASIPIVMFHMNHV